MPWKECNVMDERVKFVARLPIRDLTRATRINDRLQQAQSETRQHEMQENASHVTAPDRKEKHAKNSAREFASSLKHGGKGSARGALITDPPGRGTSMGGRSPFLGCH